MNSPLSNNAEITLHRASGDRLTVWMFAVAVLALVNAIFFWPHYMGEAIFPWDFYGGYHAMAYAWLQDGSFISPPLWSPYGNYGFPTHLAVQNSSFYLPLVVLDWLGIPYTLNVAAAVQTAHIFLGSIGLYYFLRLNGISCLSAITGGILFHLSIGFFSNAEHVDIVRGYAITPWLLVAYSRHFITDYKKSIISAWLTFIFLTGSYPGIVVAVFYVMLLYVSLELVQQNGVHNRKKYIGYIMVSGTIAIMLSSIKYLPFIAQLDEIEFQSVGRGIGISLQQYLTMFFRFDLDFIRGDITMRSYYLPPVAFILIFFTRRLTRMWLLGLSIATVVMLLVTEGPIRQWAMALPGFQISRFHLSDYRGLLHVSLITMACASLNELSKMRLYPEKILLRGFLVLIIFMLVSLTAFSNGYQLETTVLELTMMLTSLMSFILVIPYLFSTYSVKRLAAFASIWGIALASTYIYVTHAPITWRYNNYKVDLEHLVYGQELDELFDNGNSSRQVSWPSRPERILLKGKVAGNIGYYSQAFSQTGYDSGLRLKRIAGLKSFLEDDKSGSELKGILAQESRFILLEQLPVNATEICMVEKDCSHVQAGLVSMKKFGLSGSLFSIDLNKDAWLLENELYYPGWISEICKEGVCTEGTEAVVAVDYLRAWRLSKGKYTLHTYYQPPLWKLSQIIYWLAVVLSVALVTGKKTRETLRRMGGVFIARTR